MSPDDAGLPRFERTMTDAEGLLWRLEKDPHLSSTFSTVTILDRPPDLDRLRRRLGRAVQIIPRLRQRVQSTPANVTPPAWTDDPNFDLDFHVRHLALPPPGSMRQLLDLASLLTSDAFDRSRPLWHLYVIDGLEGGRSALVEKFHHGLVDGEAGVQVAMQFLDLERDPPEPDDSVGADRVDDSDTGPFDVWRDMLLGGFRFPIGVARQLRDLITDPASIPEAGSAAADAMRTVVSQLTEADASRSPLWTARSLRRRMEVLRAPFGPTRDAARRLGGTLNTAFLTCAADAAGRYHRRLGAPVDELRASMAISTRTDDSGNNAFTLARFTVPTGEMSPGERFALVHEQAEAARSTSTAAPLERLAAFAQTLPGAALTRIARMQSQTVDFATSNLRAAPIPVFVGGAAVLANFPLGPIAGVAFNLTVMSYNGSLDMGLHVDRAAVEHPDRLAAHLQQAMRQLARAR